MPKNILIVDDDRTMTGLLQALLELDGYVVRVVPHGDRVLVEALNFKPDAILMDVHLAGADGMEVLRALRQTPELTGLPVIMTSGMDMEEQCKAAGADHFLLKPYPPDALTAMLQRVLA
ncbi:MAG: response regulator [Anaerolineales bacterium]|nr:response regulator [Anaerolineales bacterium]